MSVSFNNRYKLIRQIGEGEYGEKIYNNEECVLGYKFIMLVLT